MTPGPEQGLRSEELQAALKEALAGNRARLLERLTRYGVGPGSRPNMKLAAAFAVELLVHEGDIVPLLEQLSAVDAEANDARVFLVVAAAHGWAACVRHERQPELAWSALAELAADTRLPVRLGATEALSALCLRSGHADVLVARALGWLTADDRELSYGTAAVVLGLLGEPRIVALLRQAEPLQSYLAEALAALAAAPRSAERSDARRRLLSVLPRALYTILSKATVASLAPWFAAECEHAVHPAVRAALSEAVVLLGHAPQGVERALAESLRAVLVGSAAPRRDAARVRPGTGRGKSGRTVK